MHIAMGVLFELYPQHMRRYLGPDGLMCISGPFRCQNI